MKIEDLGRLAKAAADVAGDPDAVYQAVMAEGAKIIAELERLSTLPEGFAQQDYPMWVGDKIVNGPEPEVAEPEVVEPTVEPTA